MVWGVFFLGDLGLEAAEDLLLIFRDFFSVPSVEFCDFCDTKFHKPRFLWN